MAQSNDTRSQDKPPKLLEQVREVIRARHSSAPSSLNFGVEPPQFHAGVFDAELPVDAALLGIGFLRPSCAFGLQFGQFTDAAIA